MGKSKAERGKQDKVESATRASPELAGAEGLADSGDTDADASSILLAIQSMNKMTDRFDALEATLASTQASLKENRALHAKVIDLEARSRRQNTKIVGLPEKIEGARPVDFLKKFIPELLGASNFPKPVVVDCAHRLGNRSNEDSEARPRVMIAKIHDFQVKEKILRLSHQQFPLTYNKRAIHIFPDYPAEVIKQRQAFEGVRDRLRGAGAKVGFRYPARLRVTVGTSEQVFSTPQEAEQFAMTLA
ncbi:hypothetical protein SRHO_G00022930 [Serrasalmus rhombeus]